jgi:hypothetical protein
MKRDKISGALNKREGENSDAETQICLYYMKNLNILCFLSG